jgi:hypothetical protein
MMSSLFRSSSKQKKQQAKHGGGQDEAAREETAGLRLQAPAYERVALKKPGIFSDFYLILIIIVINFFF